MMNNQDKKTSNEQSKNMKASEKVESSTARLLDSNEMALVSGSGVVWNKIGPDGRPL